MLSPTLKTEVQLWNELNTMAKQSEDHVLKAARIYYDIKVRFKSGEFGKGLTWKDYVEQNSPYSLERVKELLQIANDPDPVQKLKKMRERKRLSVQTVRADRVLRSTLAETVEPGATWVEDGKSIGTWHPNVRANWSCANRGLEPPPIEAGPRSCVRDIQSLSRKELILWALYLRRADIWPQIEKLLNLDEMSLMELVKSL
jgi:hypothetical protein